MKLEEIKLSEPIIMTEEEKAEQQRILWWDSLMGEEPYFTCYWP